MTTTQKMTSLFFLICVFSFVGGCNYFQSKNQAKRIDESVVTQTEKNKLELLGTIERKFENPDAHYELGKLYQADGLWMQAEYEYNTALSFDPAHRNAQAAIVKLLLDTGDETKSGIYADIYMNQVSSSARESLRLALGFQDVNLDEYALECYRQALHLAPNSAKINRQIGYYYLSKNDKVRAQDYLSRSFQLNPNQPEVAGELGRLGVEIKIPRKTVRNVGKLDKIVEQSDEAAAKP